MLSLVPAILALTILQEAPEATATDRIDACIARCQELEGFVARYRIETSGGEDEVDDGVLELVYEAPDRGTVRMRAGEIGFDLILGPDGVHARIPDGEGDVRWRKGTFRDAAEEVPWRSALEERFPSSEEDAPIQGVRFELQWNGMPGVDGFEINLRFLTNRGHDVLGWLPRMQRQAEEMSVEGDMLLWEGEEFRCELSLETGFPTRLEARSASGGQVKLELLELTLDDVPTDAFELPDEALAAEETPQLTSMDPAGPVMGRMLAFFRVSGLLQRGERAWDESAREDFVAVLLEVHRELVTSHQGAWIEQVRDRVESLGEHIEERLRATPPPSRDELEAYVLRQREGLEAGIERGCEAYVQSLTAGFGEPEGRSPPEYLFEAERDAARAACDECVRAPLLDWFDERTERALAGG